MYNYTFTVFTATYNRADKLHRVYDSLKTQTFTNFEWLIVDDGSTDNTKEIVETWITEADFPIRYYSKPNGGKHTAFNMGVKKAKGELLLNFDSDDACVPEALEVFYNTWKSIENKKDFSAVTGLCKGVDGKIVGAKFPKDVLDSDSIELKYKYKIEGEKWGFQRTDVLKEFPFPEPEGMKLYPEAVIWSQISRKYKTRFINKPLRIYIVGEDSYTSAPPQKYSKAAAIWHESILNECIDYFKYNPLQFFKSAVHYSRFSLHSNNIFFKNLKNNLARLLVLMVFPLALFVYLKDNIFHR